MLLAQVTSFGAFYIALCVFSNKQICSNCTAQVAVPLPDIKGRSELIDHYLQDKPFAADVDRDILARQTQGE